MSEKRLQDNTMRDKELESALKLQEIVQERIQDYHKRRKESWYPSKKRGKLYKYARYLEKMIEESKA